MAETDERHEALSPTDIEDLQTWLSEQGQPFVTFLNQYEPTAAMFMSLNDQIEAISNLIDEYADYADLLPFEHVFEPSIRQLGLLREHLIELMENGPALRDTSLPKYHTTEAGRLELVIAPEYLHSEIRKGHSNKDIALALGVSVATVKRRLRDFGIQRRWSAITEQELIDLLRAAKDSGLEYVGSVGMQGYLEQTHNVRVPRRVVRLCLKQVDSVGTRDRWLRTTRRRRYSVPFPNSLWHIDGERWKLGLFAREDFIQ